MQTQLVTKFLPTGSSTGVGSFSSGAVLTGGTATFTTARRLIVWGSSALGATITITGTSEGGGKISEVVASSTTVGATVQTVQDFMSVTAVTISCAVASTAGYIGTSSQGGTAWQLVDTMKNPINMFFYVRPTSTTVTVTLEYTNDYPSYNVQAGIWDLSANSTAGPAPIASTVVTALASAGFEARTTPFTAWRLTLTSSSSGSGTVAATVVQSG